MCFPKNFTDVLRTLTLQNADRLLLLKYLLKIKVAAPDKSSEAAVRRYFSKQIFLKISHLNKKAPVLESLFDKVATLKACNTIKKRLQRRCLPVINARVLRAVFFTEHLCCLLASKLLGHGVKVGPGPRDIGILRPGTPFKV